MVNPRNMLISLNCKTSSAEDTTPTVAIPFLFIRIITEMEGQNIGCAGNKVKRFEKTPDIIIRIFIKSRE